MKTQMNEMEKLKIENRKLKEMLKVLVNQELTKGLISAVDDFKKGDYVLLTN